MNLFKRNSKTVLDYQQESGINQTTIILSHSCLSKLGKHLESNGLVYSGKISQEWLSQQTVSAQTAQVYAKTLRQLEDVYRKGHVSFFNRSKLTLTDEFENISSEYLACVSSQYTDSHLGNIRNRCRFFFGFLQMELERFEPSEITYQDILDFYTKALGSLCKADAGMYKGSVSALLSWMSAKELCPIGFSMLLYMNRADKVLMLDDLPDEVAATVKGIGATSRYDFPPEDFLGASNDFLANLNSLRYSSTMKQSAKATLEMLYLFIDMNDLGYDPVIASLWFEETGISCFGSNAKMSRRILALFELFTQEGGVLAEKTFTYKPLLCDSLPEWCMEAVVPFLAQKKREGKAASTLCMYRSAVTRFCQFLSSEGMTSFGQIEATMLKKFNLSDRHKTVEGKNAYNVRIRKFLFYLSENGFVDNHFLGESLPCSCAPKTRVVQILTPQEEATLAGYNEPDDKLSLRNRAIALIGLKMGLRSSDITSLTFSQIDWKRQCIRFRQEKTNVERTLPMPTEVGNALYRYIAKARPSSGSPYIFITHKAPYRKVGRCVCKRIMQMAFPGKSGYGFHITRRTYATHRFRNHCGKSDVAYLLGHTTDDTVSKYIALDEERMRKCPISLKEAGIPMKGGFRNE